MSCPLRSVPKPKKCVLRSGHTGQKQMYFRVEAFLGTATVTLPLNHFNFSVLNTQKPHKGQPKFPLHLNPWENVMEMGVHGQALKKNEQIYVSFIGEFRGVIVTSVLQLGKVFKRWGLKVYICFFCLSF